LLKFVYIKNKTMPKRSGRKSESQTIAPKKDRIYGSKLNPKGSASSEKSAKTINLSSDIIIALTKKLKEFKENHPNKKNVGLGDLKAVYRRGLGAYSSTHRPTISGGKPNTRNAWAMARVNAFLRKASGGEYKKAYVQDDDLLKFKDGAIIENEFDDLNNNELIKVLKSFYDDFSNSQIFDYIGLQDGNYTFNLGDNEFVIYKDSNFTNIEKIKFGRFIQPYFSHTKKPLYSRFFDKYKIVGKNIIITLKDMYKDGGELDECIDYIRDNEVIFDNGYYFDMHELSNIIDPYGQVPLNLDFTLVSYNSGGQKNLGVLDTINSMILVDKISDLCSLTKSQSYVVVNYFIDKAKRLNDIEQIKTEKIVIVDRDKIVCENLNSYARGGNVKDFKLNFGKYKGQKLFSTPSNYYEWLLEQNFTANEEDYKNLKEGDEIVLNYRYFNFPDKKPRYQTIEGTLLKVKPNSVVLRVIRDNAPFKGEWRKSTIASIELINSEYADGGEIGNIKYTISKGKDSEERIVSFEKGDFGSYKVEKHEAKFLKGWNRNGGNGWSYEKNVSKSYPTIRLAILNYLQNKRSMKYENGGEVDDHKETYAKWKSLVNMSKSELERFYNSEEGKVAGLKPSEAKAQGIDSGRESARWIMKMKDTNVSDWTPQMWRWAKKQISFISRMSGNQGGLYDDKGRKTRKHLSLLIWGNNPEKKNNGGMTQTFENKFGKRKWINLNYKDLEDYKDEIFDIISNSYSHIGGHLEIQKAIDLTNSDLDFWIANDIDTDPYIDVAIGGKKTKDGIKLTTMAQDGNKASKMYLLKKVVELVQQKGFYSETSKELADKLNIPIVKDKIIIQEVVNKPNIKFNDDGSYDRDIHGKRVTKVLVGTFGRAYYIGGMTDKYDVADYWDSEYYGDGGEVKTKNIITNKIGWSDDVADYLIEKDSKLAIWLADSIKKDLILKLEREYGMYGKGSYSNYKDEREFIQDKTKEYKNVDRIFFDNWFGQEIRLILDWLKHPNTPKQNLKELSFKDAKEKAKKWHDELQTIGGDVDFVEPNQNEIIKEYPKLADGTQFYWVEIPKTFCDLESKRMGHCGRTSYGDRLLSLRSVRPYGKGHTINDSHVTIAYNQDKGLFYQIKGKKNQKPSEKYYSFIFDLIKTFAQTNFKFKIPSLEEDLKKFEDINDYFHEELKKLGWKDEWNEIKYDYGREKRKPLQEFIDMLAKNEMQNYYYSYNSSEEDIEKTKKLIREFSQDDKFMFEGFGREYDSSQDYGYEDMTDEQIKELYDINPKLFKGFGGQYILYKKGLISEKPKTNFDIEIIATELGDYIKAYGVTDKFFVNILSHNLQDDFTINNGEILDYYFDSIDKNNLSRIEQRISDISGMSIEEVKEKGAEEILQEYIDGDNDYELSSIFDSIRRAIYDATNQMYYDYYYKLILDALSEYGGEVEFSDDSVTLKNVDLAKLVDANELNYLIEENNGDLASAFIRGVDERYIEIPRLNDDSRFEAYADKETLNKYLAEIDLVEGYADGGATTDIRMMDTIGRINDPHFADISYYKKGGENIKFNDIVIYYEKQGNFIIPKGTFYAWLYDEKDAGDKISSGEYDFILFPMSGGFSLAMQKGYVPPLLKIWKKDFQKDKKGIEHLLGIVQGYYDEKENKLYIEMMTTNPKFRRMGVNAHIIKQVREEFEVSQDDVIFHKPTDMGKKFMASKKFDEGGTINKQSNINIMDEIKFNQLPHIDTISKGDDILIRESVFHGNINNPKHLGERYIHAKVLEKGGMLDSLNLKVLNSVGANAIEMGSVITRPIANVMNKGRKLVATTKFKEGGINPDNKQVKNYFAHGSGNVGGVLVGKRHSEGGIKAINKGTGQPLEMEGGEVVITRGAVSNPKKYDFNGKEMTTREILSSLNVDGGGVSFAEGGDVPDKMNCGCNEMKLGGDTMSMQDFVNHSEKEYQEYRLEKGIEKEKKDHYDTLSKLNAGSITLQEALKQIAQKEMKIDSKYPFVE